MDCSQYISPKCYLFYKRRKCLDSNLTTTPNTTPMEDRALVETPPQPPPAPEPEPTPPQPPPAPEPEPTPPQPEPEQTPPQPPPAPEPTPPPPVVTGLLNTGVNLVGNVDQVWRLPTLPSELVVASGTPANDAESRWIRVNQGARPNGETRYELPFSVDGDPTQVALKIHVISDGTVTDVKINGTSSGFVATADFHWTDPIVILYGFVSGPNVIQFNLNGHFFRCKIEQIPRPTPVSTVSRFFSTRETIKNGTDQNYVNVNIGLQPNTYPLLQPVFEHPDNLPYMVWFGGYYAGGRHLLQNIPGFSLSGRTFGTGRIKTVFEVTDPSIAILTFRFQGDVDLNYIVGVYLNGVNSGIPEGIYTFNGPTITISSGFVQGYNTLEIDTALSGAHYYLGIQKI